MSLVLPRIAPQQNSYGVVFWIAVPFFEGVFSQNRKNVLKHVPFFVYRIKLRNDMFRIEVIENHMLA